MPKSEDLTVVPGGDRHPKNKANSSPDRRKSVQVELSRTGKTMGAVPKIKKTWYEHLTGYVVWWRPIEKDANSKIDQSYLKLHAFTSCMWIYDGKFYL